MARPTLVTLPGLLYWRIRAGLDQGELAELAGTSRETISRIERGGDTHPKTGLKLAKGLGRNLDDLLRRQPET